MTHSFYKKTKYIITWFRLFIDSLTILLTMWFENKNLDVYERALINRNMQMAFRPGIDLWSTGVSLYHVATGMLPFRPVGGRNNRQTMYIWFVFFLKIFNQNGIY